MGRIHRRFREVSELVDASQDAGKQAEPSLAEEMAAIPYEPLLPVEKWLIAVSLILGVSLLAILSWVSANFFPVAPRRRLRNHRKWVRVRRPFRRCDDGGGLDE